MPIIRKCIFLYIVFAPFYVFPSGLPQPADFVLFVAFIFLLGRKSLYKIIKSIPIVKYLLLLLLVIVSINSVHSFYRYVIEGHDTTIFKSSFYYMFNVLAFLSTLYCCITDKIKTQNVFAIAILMVNIVLFLLAILNISGPQAEARGTLFFNNPNQLGYYILLTASLYMNLDSKFISIYSKFAVMFISLYLILYSNSRAALFGIVLLSLLLALEYVKKSLLKFSMIMLLFLMAVPWVISSDFFERQVNILESRNDRDEESSVSQFKIRGYDRIALHPEYLFYGAGEGDDGRFKAYHDGEMHSGFGTIFFSYGFISLFLLIMIFFHVLRKATVFDIVTILPVIFYNLTHQGFRNPLFWMLLAIIYFRTNEKYIQHN